MSGAEKQGHEHDKKQAECKQQYKATHHGYKKFRLRNDVKQKSKNTCIRAKEHRNRKIVWCKMLKNRVVNHYAGVKPVVDQNMG